MSIHLPRMELMGNLSAFAQSKHYSEIADNYSRSYQLNEDPEMAVIEPKDIRYKLVGLFGCPWFGDDRSGLKFFDASAI